MSYQILSFSTSPFTQARLYSLLCDTASDLPASVEGYSVGQGWTAKVIEDGSSYIANAAGSWIQQPSSNQFSNVYTKAETDSIIQRVDLDISQAELDISALHAGLETVVNSGGKNKMQTDSGQSTPPTRWINIPIVLQPGVYVVYFGDLQSNDTDSAVCQACFMDGATQVSNWLAFNRGQDVAAIATIRAQTATFRLYPSDSYAHSEGDIVTFSQAMICNKSLYDISPQYEPYCPTLFELYNLVKSYHP